MEERIVNQQAGTQARLDDLGNLLLTLKSGSFVRIGSKRIYYFETPITANETETDAPVDSLAMTLNATGGHELFYSDGAKWQAVVEVTNFFARIATDTDFTDDENPTDSTITVEVETGVYEVYSILQMSGQNPGALTNTGDAVFTPLLNLAKYAGNGITQQAFPTDFECALDEAEVRFTFTGIIRVTTAGAITFAFNPNNNGETLTILTDSFLSLKKLS